MSAASRTAPARILQLSMRRIISRGCDVVATPCYDRFLLSLGIASMARVRKRAASHGHPADDDIRNQEVLRANRELAAYFKGRRTEREARAALKIIKAFIRERERAEPAQRRPLPIAPGVKHPSKVRLLRSVASRAVGSDEPPPGKDDA